MRFLASPVVTVFAFLAGILLTVLYASLVGAPFSNPFEGFGTATPIQSAPVASSPSPSPRTARPSKTAGPTAVLVGAGDIAACDRFQDDASADAVANIPGIVFTLGDNVYPAGTYANFTDCYGPSWGRPDIKERTRPTLGGNEYKVPGAADYFRYFGAAAGDPATGYYAYNAGTWRVYVLNSACAEIGGCEAGSQQERWLRADLAEHPAACVLAMWHVPVFSSGNTAQIGLMQAMWDALDDAGAELVLNGNQHSYERFAPQNAAGAEVEEGIVEIVAGTAGAAASPFEATAPNSRVHATDTHGVLKLTLSPEGYRFEFLSTTGSDFHDRGSGTCH